MEIVYKQYRIRNAVEQDAEQLMTWWNDGNVMAHVGFPYGLQITKEKVLEQLSKHTDDTNRRLIMEIDGILIGEMCYTNLHNGSVDIGIKICETSKQEKGHGKIFLSMLIERLFQKGYEQIVLDTMIENTRAQHVYETLGFQKVRVKENCWQDQVGKMRSAIDYVLTQDKFHSFVDDIVVMDIDEKDVDVIFREMQKLVYQYEDLDSINVDYVMQWMHRKVENHKDWYRKIVCKQNVVGYYAIRNEDTVELEDFYMLEGYQGLGIGSKIMQRIINEYSKLELCVFKKNEKAIRFYRRFEFEVSEEIKTRYIMKRGS